MTKKTKRHEEDWNLVGARGAMLAMFKRFGHDFDVALLKKFGKHVEIDTLDEFADQQSWKPVSREEDEAGPEIWSRLERGVEAIKTPEERQALEDLIEHVDDHDEITPAVIRALSLVARGAHPMNVSDVIESVFQRRAA